MLMDVNHSAPSPLFSPWGCVPERNPIFSLDPQGFIQSSHKPGAAHGKLQAKGK
jgi:hypothetical protein